MAAGAPHAERVRRLAFAVVFAAVVSAAVTFVFQEIFLVRLLGQALLGFMTLGALFNVAWATLLGIVVGALPGLTATLGVALLTTLTFKMAAADAILILICMYVGAIYGGSRSAILLNIPGTPANAATTLDGFPLRAAAGQRGRSRLRPAALDQVRERISGAKPMDETRRPESI